MTTITKDKIIFGSEDWLTGIDPIETTAGADSKISNGLASSGGLDPLRKLGYISPGYAPADATNIAQVTAMLRNGVVYGDTAIMAGGGLVHKLTTISGNGTISTTAPFPYTIDHAHNTETADDIVNYLVGTTIKAFVSFNDATDWDVAVYDYAGNAFDPDFMSTVPANPLADNWGGVATNDFLTTLGKGYPHPLIVGDDDVLYMGSGRYIHAFDGQAGANGTFYGAVLTLPAGWTITCFAKTENGQLAIGAYYSASIGASTYNKGDAKVWLWNYLELDISSYIPLNDNYISELFNWNGTLACFTEGNRPFAYGSSRKLQVFTGSKFVPVVSWGGAGLPIRGGVDVVGDDIYWNASGIIYGYIKNPNTNSYSLHLLKGLAEGSSGMLKFFTSAGAHFSYGAGAGLGIRKFSSNYGGNAGNIIGKTKVVYLALPNDKKANLKSVSITFLEAVTGGMSFALNTILDGTDSNTIAAFTVVTDLKITKTFKADGTKLGKFSRLQCTLIWADGDGNTKAPTIEKIEYEYELTNL